MDQAVRQIPGRATPKIMAPADLPTTEAQAARFLFRLRWNESWRCPGCGNVRCHQLGTRPRVFECSTCGHQTSVTAGTALHRCRVPLVKVVLAALLLSRPQSISARQLARDLKLTVETAWTLCHRLRAGFLDHVENLEGEVVLSSCQFQRRPERGQRNPSKFVVATFQILWDRTFRTVAQTGTVEPHAVRRFVDRHSDRDRAFPHPLFRGFHPNSIGNGVHRGVTDRWLPLYAHAIAGWQSRRAREESPHEATLALALGSPRFPFRRLRPRAPPQLPWMRDWNHKPAWLG